jgi:hypothetical protein
LREAVGPGVAVLPLSGATGAGVPEVLAALGAAIEAARAPAERAPALVQ